MGADGDGRVVEDHHSITRSVYVRKILFPSSENGLFGIESLTPGLQTASTA